MAPKSSNYNSAYKSNINSDLQTFKNGQVENVKVDLTRIKITTLATQLDVLSSDVKLFMVLPSSNRHYALNDIILNLLGKDNIY